MRGCVCFILNVSPSISLQAESYAQQVRVFLLLSWLLYSHTTRMLYRYCWFAAQVSLIYAWLCVLHPECFTLDFSAGRELRPASSCVFMTMLAFALSDYTHALALLLVRCPGQFDLCVVVCASS
jgi:hypothetical protein